MLEKKTLFCSEIVHVSIFLQMLMPIIRISLHIAQGNGKRNLMFGPIIGIQFSNTVL